jgi:multiple sugar transport system ATP-binding protein
MVRNPSAFLFDEPLSNLDAQLRTQMRIEIKRLHQRLGTTIVYVTHDQVEAMTMADRIVVMKDGHILQAGTPMDIYENPADVFTARFIGSPSMNLLPGTAAADGLRIGQGGPHLVGVRPHDLVISEGTGVLSLSGMVTAVEPLGAETLVHFDVAGTSVIATAPGKVIPAVGSTVNAHAAPGALYVFDAKTEKALGRQ